MLNLKRLVLGPFGHLRDPFYSHDPGYTLSKCSFQLESFEWYKFGLGDLWKDCHDFLMTQSSLLNLHLPPGSFSKAACPRLKSIVERLDSYELIQARPTISVVALPTMKWPGYDITKQEILEAFQRIQYISVSHLDNLGLPKSAPFWRNIVLLKCILRREFVSNV